MDTAITKERTDWRRNGKKSPGKYQKKGSMNMMIHLGSDLIAEATYQLLMRNGYDHVVVSGRFLANGFTPDLLLVDITTLTHDLLARYPQAKVLLIDDAGIEPEKLCATLLSWAMHGILPPRAGLRQVWMDNGSVKALFHDTGVISRPEKMSRITEREQEIIECICQGLSNREIAGRLALSEHTVRAHLNNIFRKFNITSRLKLMTLAMQGPLARCA